MPEAFRCCGRPCLGNDLRPALHLYCRDHLFRLLLPIPGLYILYVIVLLCLKQPQVEDISADYRLYFSEPMGYIHLALIVLCAYVIVHLGSLIGHLLPPISRIYLTIIFSYTFLNFNLPMEADDFADITESWPLSLLNGVNLGAHSEQPGPEDSGLSDDMPPLCPGAFQRPIIYYT